MRAAAAVRNGFDPETMTVEPDCLTCGGTGRLRHPVTGKPGKTCPSCNGSGTAPDDDSEDGQQQGPGAPGAKLDRYFWARSWSSYLAAISDPQDRSGAQAVIDAVMRSSAIRIQAGMTETIPSGGGFLVPEILRTQVLSYMTSAVIRPRSLLIPMTSLREPIPYLDSESQASSAQALGGLTFAWTEEGAAIEPTAAQFGRLALEARKFAAYLANVPNELCDDSPAFSDIFLPQTIAKGLAWATDDAFINGSGVGEPQGLLNAPCAIQVDRVTSDAVTAADIVAMYKALHPASKAGNTTCWLVSDSAFSAILDIAVSIGTTPTTAAASPSLWLEWNDRAGYWTLLGAPLFPSDHLPQIGTTGDVVLADLSLYLIGERQELLIERSKAGAGFISGTSNFRIKTRLDARYWLQSSITLENSAVVSPVVILNSAT
jgi:HK97 family phage major capsid protein